MTDFDPVDRALAAAAGSDFPGAVLLVRSGDRPPHVRVVGNRCVEPTIAPMTGDTIFDLSSLTKPLATTVCLMVLVRDGVVDLDDPAVRYLPGFGARGKATVTLRQLLAHCSGLAAWRPFYEQIVASEQSGEPGRLLGSRAAHDFVIRQIERCDLEYRPGTKAVYSDLGFIVLGAIVESVTATPLDVYCEEQIYRPLGLVTLRFVDLDRPESRFSSATSIAATERCPWRGRVLCGEVHDDNAWAMGGVAGHAGLFGNAGDVDALLGELVRCRDGRSEFLPTPVLEQFWAKDRAVPGSTWGLGWDTPSPTGSMAGAHFSPSTVGHLGFTGVSVWIDLERSVRVVLLTNRVHPRRDNQGIKHFRPMIHDLINRALAA